ncbi:MAG: phosphopyruvate hydratase, partial [bacterium]
MPQITQIKAREVLDSRGRPTVEVEMQSACGCTGSAIAPSGASTGVHEAVELRDGDPAWYGGLGVQQAVSNVNRIISPLLAGKDPVEQSSIDEFMINADGTPNKSSLGANAILATSMAAAVLAAKTQKIELYEHLFHLNRQRNPRAELKLPLPMVNMISGGLHAGRNLEFQDFLIYPEGCHSYRESLERIVKIYRSLAKVLASYGETHALVGDEGGYGPSLNSNETALQRIVEATEKAGLKPGNDVSIALDVASSHFYDQSTSLYSIKELDGTPQPAEAMIAFLERLVEKYPIVSIEDGLAEDDWPGWQKLTSRLGSKVQLVGDDFFTTNVTRIRRGIEMQSANSVLIKLNQIGTVSETLEAIATAAAAGFSAVVSARSGETEDTFIADLATASGCGQIKI